MTLMLILWTLTKKLTPAPLGCFWSLASLVLFSKFNPGVQLEGEILGILAGQKPPLYP